MIRGGRNQHPEHSTLSMALRPPTLSVAHRPPPVSAIDGPRQTQTLNTTPDHQPTLPPPPSPYRRALEWTEMVHERADRDVLSNLKTWRQFREMLCCPPGAGDDDNDDEDDDDEEEEAKESEKSTGSKQTGHEATTEEKGAKKTGSQHRHGMVPKALDFEQDGSTDNSADVPEAAVRATEGYVAAYAWLAFPAVLGLSVLATYLEPALGTATPHAVPMAAIVLVAATELIAS